MPKDLKALNSLAKSNLINLPLLNSVELSNSEHTSHIIKRVLDFKINSIGIFGLAFKSKTDDLRYSKSIDLCEILLGKGKYVKVYDKAVNLSKLIGSNKSFLNSKLPHINNMLVHSITDLCEDSKLIVLVHKPDENEMSLFENFLKNSENIVLDSSLNDKLTKYKNYFGINW